MAITQQSFDVVFDAIKQTLSDFNGTQIPADQFTLYSDYYRVLPAAKSGAFVVLYLGPVVPTERTTASYVRQNATYYIDMLVKAKGQSGAEYTRADEAAGIRFRLLLSQVIQAIHDSDNFNFGLPDGTIGKKEWRIDPLPVERQMMEQIEAGGRMTLSCEVCYEPDDVTGLDLDSILITADKWSALIEP